MVSFFDTPEIIAIGDELAGSMMTAAWSVFATTATIAFGAALVRHSLGGKSSLYSIAHMVGICFALVFYNSITRTIRNIGHTASSSIGQGGKFEALLDNYQNDIDTKFKKDADQSESVSWLDAMASWGAGALSWLLTVAGVLAVITALHLYQILQAVLSGVLVAMGPVIIATSLLPGAMGLFRTWLQSLLEISMWPAIAAVLFEMIGAALLRMRTSGATENFVPTFCANLALVCCVALIPKIASRLMGAGFGSVGDMIRGVATGLASTAASVGAGVATVGTAAKGFGQAAAGAAQAVNTLLQGPGAQHAPAAGGPVRGFDMSPSLKEREAGLQSEGAERFSGGPSVGPSSTAAPRDQPWKGDFGGAPSEQWSGGPAAGGSKPSPLLSGGPLGAANGAAGSGLSAAGPAWRVNPDKNETFRQLAPGGEEKNGIYYTPNKVKALKAQGKW